MCGPRRVTCPPLFRSDSGLKHFCCLNELNSSHFSTSDIFVNNLVPESHWIPVTLKNVKIRPSRNSMKFVWVTRFRETNPTVNSVSSSKIYKIYRFSTYTIIEIYRFTLFRKISFFSGFTLWTLPYVPLARV